MSTQNPSTPASQNRENEQTESELLTVDEAMLIAAFRAGDTGEIAALIANRAKDVAAQKSKQSLFLDSAERLALQIIGELARRHHLTRITINQDDTGLSWLYRDITATIRAGLQDADREEIRRLMEGQSAD